MAVTLGGRVAEKLIYDELTSGASNDIEKVTAIGRHMVCEWGMSEKLGATALGVKEGEVFLGRDISHRPNYGEDTAEIIDKEIREFVQMAEERATKILTEFMDQLHIVAKALLEKDTLTREEVQQLIVPSGTKIENGEEIAVEVPKQVPDEAAAPEDGVAEVAEGQRSKSAKV